MLKGVDALIKGIGGLPGVLAATSAAVTKLFGPKLQESLKTFQNNLNTTFYGDEIAAQIAKEAKEAALKLKGDKLEDQAQNTIIDNQILQIDLNEELRKKRLELKDSEIEYYQALLKTTEELAKQSSLATEANIKAGDKLKEAQGNFDFSIYTSDKNFSSKKEQMYSDFFSGRNSLGQKFYQEAISAEDEALVGVLTKKYEKLWLNVGKTKEEFANLVRAIREKHLAERADSEANAKNLIVSKAVEMSIKGQKDAAQSLLTVTKEAIESKKAEIEANKGDEETIKRLTKELNNLKQIQDNLEHDPKGSLSKELQQEFDKRMKEQPEFEQIGFNFNTKKIVEGAQAVSQLTTGIVSLTSAFKVFGDESLTAGEAITQFFTGILVAIPAIISGLQSLTTALLGAEAASLGLGKALLVSLTTKIIPFLAALATNPIT